MKIIRDGTSWPVLIQRTLSGFEALLDMYYYIGMDSAKVLDEMIEKLSGIYKGLEGSKKSTAMLPQENTF